MSKPLTFAVDETTIVFAFRYALGRESAAPTYMVNQLSLHWHQLQGWTQHQIRGEIVRAIERGDAGSDCDVDQWSAVLAWDTKENEDGYTSTDDNAHS